MGMSREDVKREFKKCERSIPYGEWGVDAEDYNDIIDEIYDDFESTICDNCKYFTECIDGYNYCDENSRLNGFITKDFGCNKWESK